MLLFLAAAAAVIPSGTTFSCTPTQVWDGDGPVWCAEGPRLRIAGIAARESDGTCRRNQPCPKASSDEARRALIALLGRRVGTGPHGHALIKGPRLRCVSNGGAGRGRTGGWCVSPTHGDLSCAMLQTGTVLPWAKYWKRHRC
jgi:endonuclease YncB( thermonuclease family)